MNRNEFRFIGRDDELRDLFLHIPTGVDYVDVGGKLYSINHYEDTWHEPLAPIGVDTPKVISFAKLKQLGFVNPKDTPPTIKIFENGKWRYKEYVGIGWIDIEYSEDAVEVYDA